VLRGRGAEREVGRGLPANTCLDGWIFFFWVFCHSKKSGLQAFHGSSHPVEKPVAHPLMECVVVTN